MTINRWILGAALLMFGAYCWNENAHRPSFYRELQVVRDLYDAGHDNNTDRMENETAEVTERMQNAEEINPVNISASLQPGIRRSIELDNLEADDAARLKHQVPGRGIRVQPSLNGWLWIGRVVGPVEVGVQGEIQEVETVGVEGVTRWSSKKASPYSDTPWAFEGTRLTGCSKVETPNFVAYEKPLLLVRRDGICTIRAIDDGMILCPGETGNASVWYNKQDKDSVSSYDAFDGGGFSIVFDENSSKAQAVCAQRNTVTKNGT